MIDTQDKYPDTVVASALWNMEPTDRPRDQGVKEGKFKAEDYGKYSTMKHKGSELAPLGTFASKVPADLGESESQGKGDPRRQVQGSGGDKPSPKSDARERPGGRAFRSACPTGPALARHHQALRRAALRTTRFPSTLARGEVLALLGENGAGSRR